MLVLRLAPLAFFGFLGFIFGVPPKTPKNAQKTNPLFFSLFIKCFNFAESCESYGYCRKKAADVQNSCPRYFDRGKDAVQ